jgi:hypothetical protein
LASCSRAIVFLIGLLAGIPYGRAITRNRDERFVHGWRVAHASLCMGATTMFAVAALLSQFAVAGWVKWLIAGANITSGYGFAVALPLGAWIGHRGLTAAGPGWNRAVFAGNAVGVWASLVAAVGLLYAAAVSL